MSECNQQFDSFHQWVNKASSWLTRREGKAICFDARGRQCAIGSDFHRARDDGAFPITWIWDWQVGKTLTTHHILPTQFVPSLVLPPPPSSEERLKSASQNLSFSRAGDMPPDDGGGL
jgi:hypothetical protein